MKNFDNYIYYKGEKDNPFDNDAENAAYQFWEYESMFEHKFNTSNDYGTDKEKGFQIFLKELFIHLADRYDTMDDGAHFKNLYYGRNN